MGVRIEINKNAARSRLADAWKNALPAVAEQALTDCNHYCRVDQGTLRDSSERASELSEGRLIWDTPYARRVYYTGKPSHDENPNAALQWCEVAQTHHGKEWGKIAQKLFAGGTT